MSSIVVFGANGATGRALVEEALRAGHTVTAAVRDPAAFPRPAADPARLSVVRADVRDLDGVRAAVRGHDAVVSAVGPAGARADGLYSAAARAFVAAMGEHGVDRLVALSSSGVRLDDPDHPLWYRVVARTLLKDLYQDMRRMERIVRDSPLDWTFVRSTRIVDGPPTGTCRVVDSANPANGRRVNRADLARFVVGAVTDPRWSRRHPTPAR
ncbi:NAD(P)-dependent oxidoreductase [Saccharothrix syringae]|uniref:NAD-dependent epimerase/dehydratase family protein n=1 Tax=Saccharothrix syringae TaxID=103733 RepID=A0A5Q0H507_SACSY|nr:NAD(P)H-binding protein [Saccharothrix syringae]QFZ20920.1 NAD-dependent epimerase/dehydratase family protein [Saccharothrix syringae]